MAFKGLAEGCFCVRVGTAADVDIGAVAGSKAKADSLPLAATQKDHPGTSHATAPMWGWVRDLRMGPALVSAKASPLLTVLGCAAHAQCKASDRT